MSRSKKTPDIFKPLEGYGIGPEPLDAKGRARARILRAAMQLFQRRGYRHTSIDEIAREAGVAKGSVYLHFKSKGELLLHAIAEEKKRFAERFKPLLSEDLTPEQRLCAFIELGYLAGREVPLLSKMMNGDRELLAFLEEMAPDLREELRRGQVMGMSALLQGVGAFDQLDPQERADRLAALPGIIWGAGQFIEESVRNGLTPERYARQVAKILVSGVGSP